MKGGFWRPAGALAALLAAVMLILLVLNLLLMGYAVFYLSQGDSMRVNVSDYAGELTRADGAWSLSGEASYSLRRRSFWAMLLDAQGQVVWQQDMPETLPRAYTVSDVASFSRWYLNGWPVKLWAVEDCLFVLAQPKNSMWKYQLETPIEQFGFWPLWAVSALVLNAAVLLIASIMLTRRAQKRRDAARSEWIAAISHDVRTPLSTVLGYADALADGRELTTEQRRMADMIRQKGVELSGLIADLNLTNRLEYAMQPLNREWLSPAALIREAAVSCLNEDAQGRWPIELEIAPGAEPLLLYGDRRMLIRMLQNLLRNSIAHNPQGCAICVRLARRGRRCDILLTDAGAGFAPERLSALNRGEFRASGGGHGLGLRIVHEVATAHGALVRFENAPAGGGCVELRNFQPCRVRQIL